VVVSNLDKIYASGHRALKSINLEIRRGEIFAFWARTARKDNADRRHLRPRATDGRFRDRRRQRHRQGLSRRAPRIGLVPQELATDMFSKVWDTVSFSRGLFGKPPNPRTSKKSCANYRCGTRRTAKSWRCPEA